MYSFNNKKRMENHMIILERLFRAPVAKVWHAITDKNEMINWYFDLAEFKPEIGFKFQFIGGPSPEKQYLHVCEITEVVYEKRLTYSWRYEGYSGNSSVTFELFGQGNQTLLKLTHKGLETFPKENADFAVKNFEEGWKEIIHTSLKNYLEKKDFQHSIIVKATDKAVFDSLTQQIPEWWTEDFEGSSDQLHNKFTVRFGYTAKTIVVDEITPNSKIVWHVVDSYINIQEFKNKNEWNGTQIIWEILPVGSETKIVLTHVGLTPEVECFDVCEKGWVSFTESLSKLLNTKKGLPFSNKNMKT